MASTGDFVYMAHGSSCYGSIPLTLRLLGRDGGLSTLVSYLRVGKFMCVCIYIYIYIYILEH